MEAKFTKGEWIAVNNGPHWNNKNLINWEIQHGDDGECIVDHVYNEADAKLIAAAPEMYEMLLKAEESLRSQHCHGLANEITFLRNKINS